MSLENPRLFKTPFAGDADTSTINTVPDVPNPNDIAQKPSLAAYSTGFPSRSMTSPQAGGQPFYGQDVNGVLKDITANAQFVQAGNFYPFNADFQTAVGGYNKFAVVLNSSDGKLYQSLVDANTAPLSDTKSWFFFTDGKYVPFSGGTITGSLTVQKDLTVNGTNATRNPTASKLVLETDDANKSGFTFQQTGDVLRLGTSKNGVLSDTIAFFNSTNKNIDFSANVLSQNQIAIATVNQLLGVGQRWFNVTSKRKVNTRYTNNTGKPIEVLINVYNGSGGDYCVITIDNNEVARVDWSRGAHTESFIIPPGSSYSIGRIDNYPKNTIWSELRGDNN